MHVGPLVSVFACLLLAPSLAQANAPSKKDKSGTSSKETKETKEDKADAEASEPEPEPADDDADDDDDGDDDGDDGDDASASDELALSTESAPTKGRDKSPAAAMKGRIGVAGVRTVSGLNGVMVRGYLRDRITLGAVVGFATFTHREINDEGEFKDINTVGLIGGGPQIFYWPYQGKRKRQVYADFGVGGRAVVYVGLTGINRNRPEDATTLDIPLEIDIEVPLAAPLWIGERVAITPEFGFVARIIPGSRESDQNGDADSNPGTGVASRLGAENGPGVGFEFGNTSTGMFIGLSIGYFFGKVAD